MTSATPRPETIEKLGSAVYPSFAMLAGMQLDLFTLPKDGPMTAPQLAQAVTLPGSLAGVGFSAGEAGQLLCAW
jgi:hypothetical protein